MSSGPEIALLRALGMGKDKAVVPDCDPDADLALIRRARDGDRGAFDALYHRHVASVWRRVTLLIGPVPEREDLVQQIFLAVFRGLASFRADAAFSTFLYRVVINHCYGHFRRHRRHGATPLDAALVDELVAPGASPEAAAAQRQELEHVLRLLGRLKPKKRIALVLRTVEALPFEEIAELVGARVPAVAQRVKHAQRELAALVAKLERRGSR